MRARDRLKKSLAGRRLMFMDGAMGTMIQMSGVSGYACPEELNLSNPRLVEGIHAAYVKAGAQVIETNTFGANRRKLAKVGLDGRLPDLIRAGVAVARRSAGERTLVAGSVGPLGEFLEPVGAISPREAVEIFTEAFALFRRAGADFLLIETMSDLKEVRAACLAARETGMPFGVSMTFENDGRTVLGTTPEAAVATVEALGASFVGANCSSGPAGLLPILRRMAAVTRLPLAAQPNAGLPVLRAGRTVFPSRAEEFARDMEPFPAAGVRILGGCCGTTPDHIRTLVRNMRGRKPGTVEPAPACCLASRTEAVCIGPAAQVAVIGERVNPTGRKQLAAEMRQGVLDTARLDMVNQVKAGARLLDLNAGAPGVDEIRVLPRLVQLAQKSVNVPLVIDSTHPAALEAALSHVEGRPLINSVNASRKSLDQILPLASRYGAAVIGLAMDEKGIPQDDQARLALAQKIVRAAAEYGLGPEDILIDCLAVAAGSEQFQVIQTLSALRRIRQTLGTGTVLGVSNVSYGLPAREELNAAFLSMAVSCGLDAAIINPFSTRAMDALAASMVLSGRDIGAASFIAKQRERHEEARVPTAPKNAAAAIQEAVLQGDRERLARLVKEALAGGADPLSLNEGHLVPSLEKVGELFEKKVFFLPQVIAAAEAVREAFGVIKERIPRRSAAVRERILLATVEGDIHDLGKNILKSLLENYGYEVIDLGINVSPRVIAAKAKAGGVRLVGLSALMTTTLPAMEATLRLLRHEVPGIPVVVGGAVLTEEYAKSIGADGYAPDASRGVKVVRAILSGSKPRDARRTSRSARR